jgi:hypothetical protein
MLPFKPNIARGKTMLDPKLQKELRRIGREIDLDERLKSEQRWNLRKRRRKQINQAFIIGCVFFGIAIMAQPISRVLTWIFS